ncbi:MAG: septation protein A [Pseudorhodoplanes sp.]|nr:Intracellular septation protein [Pseudorhodoplanes sp.]MBW7948915.1 septation protein A [Pseudorhodoplanes sp.]MCL4709829.1 septation protein A [Pseudorhodoplanes sp.]MCZ7642133.1 septation protein A [Pseudorhodoplanes sp.]GIK82603.1 MAG: putative intracellular septation protein A [Alphaproteobacteria bacterium]
MTEKEQLNPFVKLALDIGPLVLFFFANSRPGLFLPLLTPFIPGLAADIQRSGIFVATAVFMVAVLAALIVSYVMIRRLPVMPLVSALIVFVFGGLTLVLHDDTFIKLKPTLIYVLFAAVLFGGLIARKPLLSTVFDSVFNLTEEGWRKLTVRWALFFVAMAILNELVWRTQSTDFWVSFKLFGFMPLTFVFAMAQYPLMKRYHEDQ